MDIFAGHYIHVRQGMHQNMTIIRNWKLAILALIFFCIFMSLGIWQVQRSHQKKSLLATYAARTAHAPFKASDLSQPNDWRFYRVTLTGSFDNKHTFFLDNKTHQGQVGYEVYTPFKANDLDLPILVDRGFVPMGESRKNLPIIKDISDDTTITGLLNTPPVLITFGKITDSKQINWPLRVEFINLPQLGKLSDQTFFPYIVNIQAQDPGALAVEWQIVTSGPERNMGYAVQWFALALTLLILFAVLNWRKAENSPRRTTPRRQTQKQVKSGTTSKKKK